MSTSDQKGICYHCSASIDSYSRADTCLKCGRATRCCKNCFFYDASAHNECHETSADRVVEKEKPNFCDYFKASDRPGGKAESIEDLKAKANKLFGI